MTKAIEQTTTAAHTKDSVMETYKTKSAAIRFLLAEGMKRGEVAKLLEIRYQHVRNVEITPIKKV